MRQLRAFLVLPILAVLAFFPLHLRAQSDYGNITGFVHDPTGASIPNASVTVHDEATGNPFVSDIRVTLKTNGQEVERVILIGVPGGKSLLVYGSGVSADGKSWWDRSYFFRADSSQTRNAPE